jgi:hypothetical protein
MNLTDNQLVEIYELVFSEVHSFGFKVSEIKNLLFDKDYWFLERPNESWYKNVINYLQLIGYDTSLLNINPLLIVIAKQQDNA